MFKEKDKVWEMLSKINLNESLTDVTEKLFAAGHTSLAAVCELTRDQLKACGLHFGDVIKLSRCKEIRQVIATLQSVGT